LFAIVILSISFAISVNSTFATQKVGNLDDRIYDLVRMKLTTDADVKGGALDVIVRDGVVTLRGSVDTSKGKKRAEQLTRKVRGVKHVINELVVLQESR
jgi:osmotically-inducible protein OsmY